MTSGPTRVSYAGTLGAGHLRHVARLALVGRGFSVDPVALDREIRALDRAGRRAAAELSADGPEILAVAAGLPEYGDPSVLLRMLGLGWRLAEALECPDGGPVRDESTAMLAAVFNAAIVVFDQIVDDEAGRRRGPFIDDELVAGIFAAPDAAAATISALARGQSEPRVELFLRLMASCAARGAAIRERYRTFVAWERLGALVERLFSVHGRLSGSTARDADSSLLAGEKSVLPSRITFAISSLTAEDDTYDDSRARIVGGLFSAVDDLADLLADLDSGQANTLLVAFDRDGERVVLADAELYDACLAGAQAITSLAGQIEAPALRRFADALIALWMAWPLEQAPPTRTGTDAGPLAAAVPALLRAQAGGYPEATHWLRFPRLDSSYETHPARLAQRAVVLDALLDAREVGIDVPEPTIAAESLAILQAKHRTVRSGWNYVPSVPELPPDADDVGQVLQALVRVGGRELASTCDEAIRLLLDAAEPDGAVGTWIVDYRGRAAADERVRAYLPVMGGWGVHPEVVANFAYGLWLYDAERFAEPLTRAAHYLGTVQRPDGHWDCHWYAGPYYGTWKATTLLASIAPGHPGISRALTFLRGNQQPDGAWGEGGPDPLATSLAALTMLRAGEPEDLERAIEALRVLVPLQRTGLWEARPWISFATVDGTETFASATITTAFCVKAYSALARRAGHLHARTRLASLQP